MKMIDMTKIMKYILYTFILTIIFTAPVFAATAKKPFMDVPENSWAYDAIVKLASSGIISGYPEGLYKGRQPITRYEAASIIARAAVYFDRNKASAEDTETLRKLMIEFKDELHALGVQADNIENDADSLKSRLDGWRMSGRVRMDFDYRSAENTGIVSDSENMGNIGLGDARLNFERWYGDRNSAYFLAQLRVQGDNWMDSHAPNIDMYYFYTRIPLFYGSFITAGAAGADDLDARFAYKTSGPGRYSTWGWFDDSPHSMIKIDFSFVILNFTAYVAHGKVDGGGGTLFNNGLWQPYSPHAWNIFTNLDVKLNQYFGFGLGAQYLIHDDWNLGSSLNMGEGQAWSNIFTSWLGLDYNMSDTATIHGIIYYQRANTEDDYWGAGDVTDRPDGGIAWRVAFDIKQDFLKFTTLYAEYMRVPCGFFAPDGILNNMLLSDAEYERISFFGNVANHDISMWKIGANQRWSDKFSTWLFYADLNGSASAGYSTLDAGVRQYGAGIEYAHTNSVMFGLNYLKWEGKDSLSEKNYSRVCFTTQVAF